MVNSIDKGDISILLEYMYQDEKKDFEESHDTEIIDSTLEEINQQIKWIEDESDEGTSHIFYTLLKLKRYLHA